MRTIRVYKFDELTDTADENYIEVIGEIWQPGTGPCAHRYDLRPYDVENIGEPTRENVSAWLAKNAGDFQSIIDFHAIVGEVDLPWGSGDESELTYNSCAPRGY